MSIEVWKQVPGYEGVYEISSLGNLRNRYKILRPRDNGHGYLNFTLYKNGKTKHAYLHRLVALTFLSNELNLPEVNHINGVRHDNRLENLEWCSKSQNRKDSWKRGTNIEKRRESSKRAQKIATKASANKPRTTKQVLNYTKLVNSINSRGLNVHRGEDNVCSKAVVDTLTGVTYSCIREAAEKLGYKYSTLKNKLNGTNKNNTTLVILK